MTRKYENRVALVTGASRGLGFAIAEALGAEGAHVVALARTTGGLEDLADAVERAGGSSTLVPLDITDEGGLQRMCAAIHERWGRLDIWAHCAIYAPPLSPAAHVAEKELNRTIAVNIRATQRLVTYVEPLLKLSDTGQAVHFDDAVAGAPFYAAYGASKAAQRAIFESWKAEGAKLGPKITLFQPPPMPTAVRGRTHPGESREGLVPPAEVARQVIAALD